MPSDFSNCVCFAVEGEELIQPALLEFLLKTNFLAGGGAGGGWGGEGFPVVIVITSWQCRGNLLLAPESVLM